MINGTFEFFIVGRVGTKFNQFACKSHKWSSSSSHQTVYIVATGCLKTLKRVHRLKYKNSCSFHKFTKDKYRIFLPWNREENINVVKFTSNSSSKIFISVQSILNRFTSALVNNVEGKIMVLWGQNRRKTTQWLCDKFETSQRREIIDDK